MSVKEYGGNNADIEKLAETLRWSTLVYAKKANLIPADTSVPPNGRKLLDTILTASGGKIGVFSEYDPQSFDRLRIDGVGNYLINLSKLSFLYRDNFTIAHELGHYFLHFYLTSPRPSTPLLFGLNVGDNIEWQANRFGAALLMPEALLREKFSEYNGNPWRIAGFFEVPRDVVIERARCLGLMEEKI